VTRVRWLALAGMLVISLALAYYLRDVVYQLLIIPLSYVLWQGALFYRAIPQLIKWSVLLLGIGIAILWQLIPEFNRSSRPDRVRAGVEGQVEALAKVIQRTHGSNYFKWQLANRLGRLSRRLLELAGRQSNAHPAGPEVLEYLRAGTERSFVDFPSPRYRFQRAAHTPLDLGMDKVIDYLESQLEMNRGSQTKSR
jgi:hypothetical protein